MDAADASQATQVMMLKKAERDEMGMMTVVVMVEMVVMTTSIPSPWTPCLDERRQPSSDTQIDAGRRWELASGKAGLATATHRESQSRAFSLSFSL